ncbi:hypothetical protein MCP1_110139 [Candidatus Terasakiella magnetica]|nr:hypothetical protein MCP1_110139 [Candidatus Terasakiella magnetica]
MFVEGGRIAPNDARDGIAPAFQPRLLQSVGDVVDMLEQAALGQQGRSKKNFDQPEMRQGAGEKGDDPAHRQGRQHHPQGQQDTAQAPRGFAALGPVQAVVQRSDDPPDHHHRMGNMAEQPGHVAQHRIQGDGHEQQHQGVGGAGRVHEERQHKGQDGGWAPGRQHTRNNELLVLQSILTLKGSLEIRLRTPESEH